MLSRVAENLYWISRYVERAENTARLLDDASHMELDVIGLNGHSSSRPMERVLTILACDDEVDRHQSSEQFLTYLTFERRNPQSILAMIARARENARGTQETLSSEAWSQLNQLYLYLSGPRAQRRFKASAARFYEHVKRSCILFHGLVDSTLSRTEVFHFLRLGWSLERVDMISRVLAARVPSLAVSENAPDAPLHVIDWMSLLRSCSAHEAYRKKYQDRLDPSNVVRYLVLDPDFPRAMRFGLACCLESLRAISGSAGGPGSEAERCLGRLDSELRYMDIDELFASGLSRFLIGVQEACNRAGQAIHQNYFLT